MLYYSLNNAAPLANFKEATIAGFAPDNGLYFPSVIPKFGSGLMGALPFIDKVTLGVEVMKPFVGNSIPEDILTDIITETAHFDFPLKKINDLVYVLELYHGPTLSFKDIGTLFMRKCLSYFLSSAQKKMVVLVATSGNTGASTIQRFKGIKDIEVVVLYPANHLSKFQEKQLNPADNIKVLKIAGSLDDCQQLVNKAFADKQLNEKLHLNTANSINIASWLPQQLYYYYAMQQWTEKAKPIVAVPSGNFGNISAGILATVSRLPINRLVAACNTNDILTNYLKKGIYEPSIVKPTLSNALDVSNPYNFERVQALYNKDFDLIKRRISSVKVDDKQTLATIKNVYEKHGYLLDPHAAVAYAALQVEIKSKQQRGMLLATAHPVKRLETINNAVGKIDTLSEIHNDMLSAKTTKPIEMNADYQTLKSYLMA